jgi:hypothetical protein
MQIDKGAVTRWNKANYTYQNYRCFIEKKSNRFELSLVDLFYISNFKGGNATIQEPEEDINRKLVEYSTILKEISNEFSKTNLSSLSERRIERLIELVNKICYLTQKDLGTKIDGLSCSYLSALLHLYFPNLLPILDRRILINLKLVKQSDMNGNQVTHIERFYPILIKKFANLCRTTSKNIRVLDQEIFIQKLR